MEYFLTILAALWISFMSIGLIIVVTYMMWDVIRSIFKGET